ncbi:MAG: hypothetical protein HF967_08650 [Methanosarcinales archaeon]|nr:hypothetical protein [Methanosarcinales archaeon]
MKLLTITCSKSRTLNLDGLLGRDAFRKIQISATAELMTVDEKNNPVLSYEVLSDEVDKMFEVEIRKLKESIKC